MPIEAEAVPGQANHFQLNAIGRAHVAAARRLKLVKGARRGTYCVHLDGKPTTIMIEKGPAPKYGMTQTWGVVDDDDDRILFEARGRDAALSILITLMAHLAKPDPEAQAGNAKAAMIGHHLAMEWGFRAHEKGHNLEAAQAEFAKLFA